MKKLLTSLSLFLFLFVITGLLIVQASMHNPVLLAQSENDTGYGYGTEDEDTEMDEEEDDEDLEIIEEEEDDDGFIEDEPVEEDEFGTVDEGGDCGGIMGAICKRPYVCHIEDEDIADAMGTCRLPLGQLLKTSRYSLKLVWGNVFHGEQSALDNIQANTLVAEEDETKLTNFNGYIELTNGYIKRGKPILFEKATDQITLKKKHKVAWDSMAGPHIDGIGLVIMSKNPEEATLTIKLGNKTLETLTYDEIKAFKGKKEYTFGNDLGAILYIHRLKANNNPFGNDEFFEKVKEKVKKGKHFIKLHEIFDNLSDDEKEALKEAIENADEETLTEILEGLSLDEEETDKLLEYLSSIPENQRFKMLKKKAKIMKKTKSVGKRLGVLNTLIGRKEGRKVQDMLQRLEKFNFPESMADEVESLLEDIFTQTDGKVSKREVVQKLKTILEEYADLIEEAKDEKYKTGIIPFKDTDDAEWFTKFVHAMKKRNIVSGYSDEEGNPTGEYGPGNNVTVAEMLKIALHLALRDVKEGGDPRNAKAIAHWAKKYFKKAEDMNLDIVDNQYSDPNRLATRAEVVRLLLEALGIEPEPTNEAPFDDVTLSHPFVDWIAYAKELEIIKGDEGTNNFRPGDSINRAEVAKIVEIIIQLKETAEEEAISEENLE